MDDNFEGFTSEDFEQFDEYNDMNINEHIDIINESIDEHINEHFVFKPEKSQSNKKSKVIEILCIRKTWLLLGTI